LQIVNEEMEQNTSAMLQRCYGSLLCTAGHPWQFHLVRYVITIAYRYSVCEQAPLHSILHIA